MATRKDYEQLAAQIKVFAPYDRCSAQDMRVCIAKQIGMYFAASNPNFDVELWLKNCGVPS